MAITVPGAESEAFDEGGAFARLEPAEAQLLRRAINEQIRALTGDFASEAEVELLCECAHPGCHGLILLAPAEYEGVRRFPTRFLVRPNHATLDTERVVADGPDFAIVEKVGDAATLAIRNDPCKPHDRELG
jgi:hypothetical protein